MKRTRRTLPGTLAPGDAYAPSLFEDEHPAPPAPLALFAIDTGAASPAPTLAPRCAVCADDRHQADACPRGAALDLFAPDSSGPQVEEPTWDALHDGRYACLVAIAADEDRSPFLRRKADEAARMIEDGAPEDRIARHVHIITAQDDAPEVPAR